MRAARELSRSTATGRAELLVDGGSRATLAFAGSELRVVTTELVMDQGAPERTITLRATGDDGSWDLYIDRVEVFYRGAPDPAPPTPQVPETPVAESGAYRNLCVELGKSEAEVDARVARVVNQLFCGNDDERIYYESGSDEAYVFTADTDDVRSEGMSYGMMFSVQLDKQAEFDRLWKFAKTHMQHASGDRTGYFAWRVRPDGTQLDANPASDGKEYFAAALFMAARRWGNGAGIYDYEAEANYILAHMLHHRELTGLPEFSGIANMIDPAEKQIVFSIEGQSATFTDPSYHLPHFYELFARWAAADRELWLEIAAESRQLFRDATHPTTGLAPGRFRYYDGCLYLFGLLNVTGRYRIIGLEPG